MGLKNEFVTFFLACRPHRRSGFLSFMGTLILFNVGWVLSIVLRYNGEEARIYRWCIALPPFLVGLVGFLKISSMINLAASLLYSGSGKKND